MKRMIPFLFILFFILFFSCDDSTGPVEGDFNVKYSVTGTTKSVNITYQNDSGGISQLNKVRLPWNLNIIVKKNTFVYVSAQNNYETGKITVTIYKNGKLFKTATSSGAYVIATASGMIK